MRNCFLLLALAITAPHVDAQEAQPADPYDLSAINARIEELGLPTPADVAQLEARARAAYDSGDCAAAIPALNIFGRNANWLSNLITAGLEPFYGASSSNQREFRGTQALIPIEAQANEYKGKRDEAMVMQADCMARTGQNQEAVALYVKVLDLIPLDNEALWTRARSGLYALLGLNN